MITELCGCVLNRLPVPSGQGGSPSGTEAAHAGIRSYRKEADLRIIQATECYHNVRLKKEIKRTGAIIMQHKQLRRYKAAGILSAAVLAAAGLQLSAAAEALGDLNRDGTVDRKDVTQLAAWLTAGTGSPDRSAADINEDGTLDAADLTLLKRMLLYKEPDPVYIHLKDSGITYEGGRDGR